MKKPFSIKIYQTGEYEIRPDEHTYIPGWGGYYTMILTIFWIPVFIHSFQMSSELAEQLWAGKIYYYNDLTGKYIKRDGQGFRHSDCG